MKKGDRVELIDDREIVARLAKYRRLRKGAQGVVVATRPLIDSSILVKFRGHAAHISLRSEDLKVTG